MKEGFWLNADTGKWFEVDDHAFWIQEYANAKKLGLSKEAITAIKEFDPFENREELLIYAVESTNIIRVRGHGDSTTFEFAMQSVPALWAIFKFSKEIGLGEYSNIFVANIRTKENFNALFGDFKKLLTEQGPEVILRNASKKLKFN
jgi:hypothetical protein